MKEKISYAKTVYGEEEINAVIKCLNESTQMGNYSRNFVEIAKGFFKKLLFICKFWFFCSLSWSRSL